MPVAMQPGVKVLPTQSVIVVEVNQEPGVSVENADIQFEFIFASIQNTGCHVILSYPNFPDNHLCPSHNSSPSTSSHPLQKQPAAFVRRTGSSSSSPPAY